MANSDMNARTIELRLSGKLDMPAARTLCDDLIAAARTPFVVDVRHVTEIDDRALAHVCRAVSLLRGRVALRGLSRRHSRMLSHRGVPPPRRAPREPVLLSVVR